ncbi:unnamed protein product [Rotaria sp. Silwood1]|nr:unnamed protein product [Rotaria sp. Silwood1]CAF1629815.1 unnamed protein product [Rotaria sp. Silwood1]CAF3762824.1 unnamed protein product [Rotaria sp. Silwood1]CAF3786197.1 unnamed protein product [Rotaria sp. Silwood1]CAF3825568.1 unnamed protein product [Rotaria sp. Silwood1]
MVNPFVRKFVPLVNFLIATAALGFQVGVLYPWHHQLEQRFNELEHKQEQKLEDYHQTKMQTMKNIEEKLLTLNVPKESTTSPK